MRSGKRRGFPDEGSLFQIVLLLEFWRATALCLLPYPREEANSAMKVIFSRKGFDSSNGRVPSPFVNGRPCSLPILNKDRSGETYSGTTYENLGLGDLVEKQTKGRISRHRWCHADPAFHEGRCALGQTSAAQGHLRRQKVGPGSLFLFFGLFANPDTGRREHWLFGYMRVETVRCLGERPNREDSPSWLPYCHPNTVGFWHKNNTMYVGEGRSAGFCHPDLRLTAPEGSTSLWKVPVWLHRHRRLSYHGNPDLWHEDCTLQTVGRGQEFVCDITDAGQAAHDWLDAIVALMGERPRQ